MRLNSARVAAALSFIVAQVAMSQSAPAADVTVISGGAFKQVLTPLAAEYEKESGNKINVTYRTVGQHLKLIHDGGEVFDVAVLTPEAILTASALPGTACTLTHHAPATAASAVRATVASSHSSKGRGSSAD